MDAGGGYWAIGPMYEVEPDMNAEASNGIQVINGARFHSLLVSIKVCSHLWF
jgi:hypothetical protein